MTWTYAGQYSDSIQYKTQGPIANSAITITTAASSPATLYTNATKGTPLGSNIVTTDSLGNLAFFADPATYTCTDTLGGSFTAVVAVNPLEFPSDPEGFATTAALTAETNRAEGAESTLTTNLAAEVTNRTSAVSAAITTAETFATSAATAATAYYLRTYAV